MSFSNNGIDEMSNLVLCKKNTFPVQTMKKVKGTHKINVIIIFVTAPIKLT